MTRRTKRGRKLPSERLARSRRQHAPVVGGSGTVLNDPEPVVHDHGDDRWYGDCPACNPEFAELMTNPK